MDNYDRTVTFIDSLYGGNTEFLDRLEKEAKKERIPIIRRETQRLLKLLLFGSRPKEILEIGSATGFSAILMAQYSDAHITTIEKYEKRFAPLKENIRASGFEKRITVLYGEALDYLEELAGKQKQFDLIFMDAAKAQYIVFLPFVLRLLKEGGILVSDNVLQDGDIIESRFAVRRRDRTIHARMREYLYELTHNEALYTDVLSAADGMTVSVKLK